MAGIITALAQQKKNKKRINVFIDNTYALALSIQQAQGLHKGQHLSDKDIARLKQQDALEKSFNLSLNFLSYRARTEQEVRQYLQKKEFAAAIIETTVDKLKSYRYLNDAEFGRQWVEGRSRSNPKGKRALRYELRQKGLDAAEIDRAIAELDEDTLAWQAIQKKLARWQLLDDMALKKKLTAFLARRGFNYQTISTVLERAKRNQEDFDIDDDY